jgi:D-alanine-D-alanine ligase
MDPTRYEVVVLGVSRDGRWMLPDASRKVLEGGPLELPAEAFSVEGESVSVISNPEAKGVAPLDTSGPLDRFDVDVVFPVMHGPYGEDGTMQGLMELADLPYVGAGVLGSALGMDKEKMKTMFVASGLPAADFVAIRDYEWRSDRDRLLDETAWKLGFPAFTKPANLGSSVGITKCVDLQSLEAGIEEAFRHDRKILIEASVPGRELECGVIGNEYPEASVVGEIVPGREFYDYVAKYVDDSSRAIIPASIPDPVAEIVRSYAVRAFKAIDAEGMARVDFFYDDRGRGVVVNEINTIPGFTEISMFPKMWEAAGLSYSELIDRLIALALERHSKKRRPEQIPPSVRGERPDR